MRQQTVARLRIFIDGDEVAIGKGGNGGFALRSGHPTGAAVYAEVDLFLAERVKSGSHRHPPIFFVPSGQQGLRNWVWSEVGVKPPSTSKAETILIKSIRP